MGIAAVGGNHPRCRKRTFSLPDLGIHAEAGKRRADFRHALGSFLDLVVISLAGGAGVEGALSEAAAIGHGWSFAQLAPGTLRRPD